MERDKLSIPALIYLSLALESRGTLSDLNEALSIREEIIRLEKDQEKLSKHQYFLNRVRQTIASRTGQDKSPPASKTIPPQPAETPSEIAYSSFDGCLKSLNTIVPSWKLKSEDDPSVYIIPRNEAQGLSISIEAFHRQFLADPKFPQDKRTLFWKSLQDLVKQTSKGELNIKTLEKLAAEYEKLTTPAKSS